MNKKNIIKPKQLRVIHLSSVHPRYDIRIFYKFCQSLADNDYEVYLVIADGKGDEVINGVSIIDAGKKKDSRLSRMTTTVNNVFKKALEIEGDIFHLHDPELIPIGIKLKKLGKKVIFDAHEDLPKQILSKPYLNQITRFILSKFFYIFESVTLRKFDILITATPSILKRFYKFNPNSFVIFNYPLLNEFKNSNPTHHKDNTFTFVGAISEIRGINQIISALKFSDEIKLNLVGSFENNNLQVKLRKNVNWKKVNYLGYLNRNEINNIFAKSFAGIVTFLKEPNHINALPNKMFEYMSAGLPIVASNFPLWKKIIEDANCGICVDPYNEKEISDALQYFFLNPKKAHKMGLNGRIAIENKFNWSIEKEKLLEIYKKL